MTDEQFTPLDMVENRPAGHPRPRTKQLENGNTMSDNMTRGDRDVTTTLSDKDRNHLIRIAKARAKQAEKDADVREQILRVEVVDLMNAEFEAQDRLWDEAIQIAKEASDKANTQIRARCVDLGIPPQYAPQLSTQFLSRSSELGSPSRRRELRELAEERLEALTRSAKAEINRNTLNIEERLILGGMESDEAQQVLASMPTVDQLMPALGLEDLGVTRWQPDDDAAAQLMTPLTTNQRRQRQIRRAIEAHPDWSDRRIAQDVGCDHKTVATHRRDRGELLSGRGEFPSNEDSGTEDT